MPYLTIGEEQLYYEDHGAGRPVVLIHGWPLSGASWEKQVTALLDAGYRVITYDRRGFGASSKPTFGYDTDALADDLHEVITKLQLRGVALVGFSMGTGEVIRYLATYGSMRVSRVVLIAPIAPFLLRTPDNPLGVDGGVFEGIRDALLVDRLAYLTRFLASFYNFDVLGGTRVSEEVLHFGWNIASHASPTGTLACVSSWLTDFRGDLASIDVPTLVVQGDADRILPLAATGARLPEAIAGSRLVVVKGGPHGLCWTHDEVLHPELLAFLRPLRSEQNIALV